MLGDSEMLYKGSFLEGAIRVPFIYKPPQGEPSALGASSNRPLPLTGLLRQVLGNLPSGGTIKPLQRWARRQTGAVVEFGAERLYIRGVRKLCVNAEGQTLWATHIGKDPNEQRNQLIDLKPSQPRWMRLIKWAEEEQLRRSSTTWIWRRLTDA